MNDSRLMDETIQPSSEGRAEKSISEGRPKQFSSEGRAEKSFSEGKPEASSSGGNKFPYGKELKRRTTRRAKFRDYRAPGFYMITIMLNPELSRRMCFCRVEGSPQMPEVRLSSLGSLVDEKINTMPDYTPQLEILKYVIMPDHLHILIHVKENLERHLGRVIGGFMGGCTSLAKKKDLLKNGVNNESLLKDRIKNEGPMKEGESLFAAKFHDRVVTKKGQIQRLKDYIADNPRRFLIKRSHPDLFRRYLHLRIGDREYAAYGNIFLLKQPYLLPVRIHRRWSPSEFAEYEERCLCEIEEGAVVISPFIHPAEKAIRNKAIEKGNKLIILRDQGFEERFKPQGKYFELCAAGQLLLLAPWPENTGRKSTSGSREFHSMNDMAMAIASLPSGVRTSIINCQG